MSETPIALVTGASRGLGLEACRQLGARGVTVVLTARTPEAVEAGLRGLGDGGDQVIGTVLDVASDASVDGFFERFWKDHDRIDILVNNAARTFGGLGGSSIESIPPETLLEAVDNNAIGAYRLIRHVLPVMNRNGYGRIVNISTGMAGLSEMGGGSVAYRVSKTALNAITRVTHAEAGPNVKVNSVCPGWVRTDMGGSSAPRSLEQGASGIVWAATLPDDGPSGGFFRDGKPIAW
jgi:NAD(P)-dependent dehydrogenase (short-subunit alcohol dehydrogenase family)